MHKLFKAPVPFDADEFVSNHPIEKESIDEDTDDSTITSDLSYDWRLLDIELALDASAFIRAERIA